MFKGLKKAKKGVKVKRFINGFWRDEKGSILTIENIGYGLLVGGAVALVGFGFTSLARGKTGEIFGAYKSTKAMSGSIDDTSGYGYTATSDANTGIQTGATGN